MIELTIYDRARMDDLDNGESLISEDGSLCIGRFEKQPYFTIALCQFDEDELPEVVFVEFDLTSSKESIEEYFNEKRWKQAKRADGWYSNRDS